MIRLLRLFPELEGGDEVRSTLSQHLSAAALDAETRPAGERPYGWAWALELAAEVMRWDGAGDIVDVPAVARFATGYADAFFDYLPRPAYPVRHGTHANSAFALLLVRDYASAAGNEQLLQRADATARRWYLHDRDAPSAFEPSGEDFLSPILTEAHLMSEVLGSSDFDEWYERFLPGTAEVIPPPLREPPTVLDDEDGKLVHLRGLTLSRAWSWRAIGRGLPARDDRRVAALDAADHHLADGLEHVLTGSYAGDHWLVTFALLALTGL